MPPHEMRKQQPSSKAAYKFASAADIKRSLNVQDQAGLVEALTALRNQLTVKYGESALAPHDQRINIARTWLQAIPGAQDIFDIWEASNPRQTSLLSLIVAVLSSLLNLLSAHYIDHVLAQPILKSLLSPQWMYRLNSYLGGSHTELVLVTLKLLNSMSGFGGGRERKTVLEAFAWETKALPKLLYMRRKGKTDDTVDILARPDIRTLYVLFILSFVDNSTPSVKAAFLEQRRDVFTSLFKGLSQDSYSLVRKVLEVCWTGIWSDSKLRRTLKINLFNESTLVQLVRLYERASAEGGEPDHIPADVVHHFLLAICTRPGIALCFRDRGWYPRKADGEEGHSEAYGETPDDGPKQKGSRIYNKILANVLKTLKVNDDPRQQELSLKILAACPELVAGYWSSAALALEPRLSSKWIVNIAFLGAVVSLPVPQASFLLPDTDPCLCNPAPPPLAVILENIVPSAHLKTHLSRGLQAPAALVQHCSALALAKCLMKYDAVRRAFEEVERALEEDEDGQWARRRRELEREVRKRIPDFQVVVGFSQRLGEDAKPSDEAGFASVMNLSKGALLAESAQRLLWLYHRSLPALVAEARFDVGKLLQGFQDVGVGTGAEAASATGMDILRQLHVLRLLRESDQFSWSGKIGSSHSNLYTLLKLYVGTEVSALRTAIASLLRHVLSTSVIFQHDADEISLWLDSLPTTRRAPDAKTPEPDGTALTEEGHGVIIFLDDCVQRCVKTPYRYLEELQALASGSADDAAHMTDYYDEMPSPLLVTLIEQLGAKLKGRLLTPSDALAVVSFVRKLALRLASKMPALGILDAIAEKVRAVAREEYLFQEHTSVTAAIEREVEFIDSSLRHLRHPSSPDRRDAARQLLSRIEHPISEDGGARKVLAFELVDWLRLVDQPVDIGRLVMMIEQLHRPALKDLFEYLNPERLSFWECSDAMKKLSSYVDLLNFELLWVHCTDDALATQQYRQILVDCLFKEPVDSIDIKRALRLSSHMQSSSSMDNRDDAIRDILRIQAMILRKTKEMLSHEDYNAVAEHFFQFEAIKGVCFRPFKDEVRKGLAELLDAAVDFSKDDAKQLVSEFTMFWSTIIRQNLNSFDYDQKATALLWMRYSVVDETLSLLDSIISSAIVDCQYDVMLIEELLRIAAPILSASSTTVTIGISRLLQMRTILPDSRVLESLIGSALRGSLPLCQDGLPMINSVDGQKTLADLTSQSKRCWPQHLRSVYQFDITSVLETAQWTDSTVEIITSVVYRQLSARPTVVGWLKSASSVTRSATHLAHVLFTLFDAGFPAVENPEFILPHFGRLLRAVIMGKSTRSVDADGTHSLYSKCVALIWGTLPTLRAQFLALVKQECQSLAPGKMSPSVLAIGQQLTSSSSPETRELLNVLVDLALGWAVRYCSGHGTDDGIEMLVQLAGLLTPSTVKSHLAEPVLAAAIQNRLSDRDVLHFVRTLISKTQFKPATVNRHLQSIVQHARLYELCAISSTKQSSSRDGITGLLHTLFHLHPNNTCQSTHVEPLRRLYGGSLSLSDRRLLSIFYLFESTRKMSVGALFTQWASSADVVSSSTLEAVQTLDPSHLLKTCLAFPNRRRLREHVEDAVFDELLYDPVFVILLFAQMFSDGPPSSALGWVQLFRTNAVSLLIRTLSARDEDLREVAFAQLAALYRCLQDADMQEKPHVLHILNLLKDLLSSPSADPAPRLPTYTTLLLAHALRALFYPANFVYPLTARFLLQRPALDAQDVPLLFGMLYSAGDAWKKERAWLVRFLADGMAAGAEWRVLQRRHTWDLLASLFQSEQRDAGLRRGVLEVLANITGNVQATTSLVLKHSLLAWIEMQLTHVRGDEGVAWIKILENVVAVTNAAKMEAATNGEWRFALGRCLFRLLGTPSCTESMFLLTVPVVLRLSLLSGGPIPYPDGFFIRCLSWLAIIENSIIVSPSGRLPQKFTHDSAHKMLPPHPASCLYDVPDAHAIQVWGECVEALWRVAMVVDEKCPGWDELTGRLLVWRSIVGEERSVVGEWARKELLRNLGTV